MSAICIAAQEATQNLYKKRAVRTSMLLAAKGLSSAYIFSIYSTNLPTVLREGLFGAPASLKSLSQIANVRKGMRLFLYAVDTRRLYHAGWYVASKPFLNTTQLNWEGGVFPYRLKTQSTLQSVFSMPIHLIEAEIHQPVYKFGFDRCSFRATTSYWLNNVQAELLAKCSHWTVDTRASAWQAEPAQFANLDQYRLRPFELTRKRVLHEQRLTLLLQKFQNELASILGEPVQVMDSYRFLSSSNVLRGALATGCDAAYPKSIFEAQGELDLLAVSKRDRETIFLMELKCQTLNNGAVQQLLSYALSMRGQPVAKSFERIQPVLIAPKLARKLDFSAFERHHLLKPIVLTYNLDTVYDQQWWSASLTDLELSRKLF